MFAYEFYVKDKSERAELVGILPERRRNGIRITQESIMRWGKLVAPDYTDPNRIYFVRVEI